MAKIKPIAKIDFKRELRVYHPKRKEDPIYFSKKLVDAVIAFLVPKIDRKLLYIPEKNLFCLSDEDPTFPGFNNMPEAWKNSQVFRAEDFSSDGSFQSKIKIYVPDETDIALEGAAMQELFNERK